MSSIPQLGALLVLALIFLVGFALPSSPVVHASESFPDRSWYFHADHPIGEIPPFFYMNEGVPSSSPSYGTVLSWAFCGADQFCMGSHAFPLSQSYPNGFDIEPGNAALDLWMMGDVGSTSSFQGAIVQFNFTLYGSTSLIIATTIGRVSLPPYPVGSPRWNGTTISLQVPRSYTVSGSSSVSFNMTWKNPANNYNVVLGFNNPGQPSRLRVPANYYSTSVTMGVRSNVGIGTLQDPYVVRIGQSAQVYGVVMNLYNNTGIPGVPVTITLVMPGSAIQPTILATVSTSSNGDYAYNWSPQSPALLGEYAVFASWPGTHFFAANVSQGAPTPPYYGPYTNIEVQRAYSSLSLQLGVPVSNPGSLVAIRGSLGGLSGPISGANVVFSYQVPGSGSTTITSAQTDSTGFYQAVWNLPATGNFTVQASWSGTDIQDQGVATAFLLSVPAQGSSIWASAPSAVSGLTFSTATGTLTLTLSPPAQAGSSVTIYIPKSISAAKPSVPLTVDGTSVPYIVQDANAGWQISFTLPNNSTSHVHVAIGPLSATQGNFVALVAIGGMIAAASAGSVIFYWKRWPGRSTTKPSGA